MTDSGASSGSTAKFGDSDSLERAVALPTVEELGSIEDAPILAASDEELGSAVFVPSVVSGILSTGLISSGSSTATAKVPSRAWKRWTKDQNAWEDPTTGNRRRYRCPKSGEAICVATHNVLADTGYYVIDKGTGGTIAADRAEAYTRSRGGAIW